MYNGSIGDWQAFLFETMTGTIITSINLNDTASFSIPLTDDATMKFSLDKTDLPDVDLNVWLEPWISSVLITFQGRAIYAGPIISNPKEYAKEIQFDTSGPRSILARRYIISESALDSPSIAKGVVSYKGMSLGTIAQEVVKFALAKPGGNLPIRYVSPRESHANDADHQRNYKAYDVNTLNADDVLTKLSEVGGGPDIAFRPKMVDDTRVVWEMHHGTEDEPRIAQKIIPEWDLTAVKSDVISIEITKTGTYLADRVITTGGGTNEATVMAVAEDFSRNKKKKYPMLETAYNVSDTENKAVLQKHAKSTLYRNRKPLMEFTLFVDAYGEYPFGTFWPGDLIYLYTKGYMNLDDGLNKMRLLNISGNYGSSNIRLALQLNDQWE